MPRKIFPILDLLYYNSRLTTPVWSQCGDRVLHISDIYQRI